ncbi:hypothetical protein PsorP6_016460 [Peronosclerospora sorghi]|uniref:Uncharacterized protein n=1 Tax=Peronosclerospora sorghi TaxID=230839 RepID=A0ACC0VKZ2_9STRA|nr:hypothetical protein PsorP6_016460 [Peronosclerospora sorghi]
MLLKQATEESQPDPDSIFTTESHRLTLVLLPLSAPFRSPLLADARTKVVQDVQRIKCVIKGSQLQVPVYASDAEVVNLQTLDNIIEELINLQLLKLVDWTATWAMIAKNHSNATHILDFGPELGVT